MTPWETYLQLLKQREGLKLTVYLDSLGKPTVGVGHLITPDDGLQEGDTITQDKADAFLKHDAQFAWEAARLQMKQADITQSDFQPYLASVCFQLGNQWTTKFPHTWDLICEGLYDDAAIAITKSLWARQTPVRVRDFAEALCRLSVAS